MNFTGILLLRSKFLLGCCYKVANDLLHLWLTPVTLFASANTTHVSLQFSAHRSKLELVLMVQNLEVLLATVHSGFVANKNNAKETNDSIARLKNCCPVK